MTAIKAAARAKQAWWWMPTTCLRADLRRGRYDALDRLRPEAYSTRTLAWRLHADLTGRAPAAGSTIHEFTDVDCGPASHAGARQVDAAARGDMDTVTSSDGTTIAFDRLGDGPPLILVDGALAYRGAGPMGPLASILAGNFTVIHYDRRGRGGSGDTAPYAVERELEDLDAVIDAAGGSAFVHGTSAGAVLAIRAAAGGAAITKLGLYEPPFAINDKRPAVPADYVARLEEMLADDRRSDAVDYFLTETANMSPAWVAAVRTRRSFDLFDGAAHTLLYDAAVIGDGHRGLPLPAELADAASSVKAPTLVVDGGANPWLSDAADAVTDLIPNAQRRALDRQGHIVRAAAIAPVLIEFFEA